MVMQIYDLSHSIKPGMPVFPGTEPPLFVQGTTIVKDGFAEKKITLFSHTGTHIDAPAHIFENLFDLDQLPINTFFGKAICINLSNIDSDIIDKSHLKPFEQQLKKVDFAIIATGWNKYWGTDQYYSGFPVLSTDAAKFLCGLKLKGVGFDVISADKADSHSLPIHRILLKEMIIIENLSNLLKLPTNKFLFSCLPLKIENGDGSPVRAVAICDATTAAG